MIDIGLHRRVALVTGAAYGLGRASAALFAAAGAWVAVNYRADIHGAKSLVDAIRSDGGRALLAPGDLRTSEGAWTVARYVEHEWGQIDIVLHTAALLSSDEIVTDPFPLLSELTPGMHARDWGRVVVVNPPGPAVSGHELALRWGAPKVLINAVLLASFDQSQRLAEAVAPAILFFGSSWNSGLTGTTLTIDPTDVAWSTSASPAGDDPLSIGLALH
jgi:NAD(P)-dependent dehydrogenase (short-subunit alcohol dehydrogenase family)